MDPFDLRLWHGFAKAGGGIFRPAIIDQITIDSRRINSAHALFVPLEGNVYDGHKFIIHAAQNGARYAFAKKGWKTHENLGNLIVLEVENPLVAFQEVAEIYRKQLSCKVIGITGSYGKTMVKDLLQAMLSSTFTVAASPESFNSQIGVPLSLLTIRKQHEIAIIEAGFSHKNEMDTLGRIIGANYGILTHVGKKHISTLGSLETTAKEMLKLFEYPPKKQWLLLPQDPHLYLKSSSLGLKEANYHFWTESNSSFPHASFISEARESKMAYCVTFPNGHLHCGQITSEFYYFLDLINITVKAAWLLGIATEAICDTLSNYTPEPTRTEIWKSPQGATFINDTYSSDPQSVDKALVYFQQAPATSRKVFAFGGLRATHEHVESDLRQIGKAIKRASVDHLFLFGSHSYQSLIDEVKDSVPAIQITQSESYRDILNLMSETIKADDIVLIKGDRKQPIDLLTEAFNDSICSNQCIINLAAIADNIGAIRNQLSDQTRLMVMVKALAYGTDDFRIAKFLETCRIDILGVSCVDEGIALKRAGVSQSIFAINSAYYEAAKAVKWDLEIGVSDKTLVEAIAKEADKKGKKMKVHLHVDTGMGRFGCRPEDALDLAHFIIKQPSLVFEGVMTHFAAADDASQDEFTLAQAKRFDAILDALSKEQITPKWIHASNSSAIARFNFPRYNMARVGLAIYGLHSSQETKRALELRLAISLISRIVGINTCHYGDTISYGRSYRVQKEKQRVAVLPIGYFDGLHRNYSGKGIVIIRGQKAPMVGKICMDFMMVDVTDIPNASPGDPVLIFGEDEYGQYRSPEELATSGDSIVYELITCLGPRIQRIFVHEEARRKY